jgi:CRISPR-associated endonuclease/helicase Cas3
MEILAHTSLNREGTLRTQSFENHANATAELAMTFAKSFGSEDWVYFAGLLHDLGKCSNEFQSYIRNSSILVDEHKEENRQGKRVEHSIHGALFAEDEKILGKHGRVISYAIAGHHAGLADGDGDGNSSLQARFKRAEEMSQLTSILRQVPDEFQNQLFCAKNKIASKCPGGSSDMSLSFWIRMMYSCLVDADFLDTENFMNEDRKLIRERMATLCLSDMKIAYERELKKIEHNSKQTEINLLRRNIRLQCEKTGDSPCGIFSLSVPTGGGKTLSSLGFALNHAIKNKMDRIIYVIPYTSIIEQTADEFRKIFGDIVVEHQSALVVEDGKEDTASVIAADNWDAPLIVTTSVQFFESLFASRSSKCRKLHNIANSVVIVDEAQMLPADLLAPILSAIKILNEQYKTTFLLCTATQPALGSRKNPFGGTDLNGLDNVKEIIADTDVLYKKLERVKYNFPAIDQQPENTAQIAAKLLKHDDVLCIVNTRNCAQEIFGMLPEKGSYHLSRYMCGEHISQTIKAIKKQLVLRQKDKDIKIRVVSTQLIEAGVDIDFSVVYRVMAGLDSIVQAGGRCNREGLKSDEIGNLIKGEVNVFILDTKIPSGQMRFAFDACGETIRNVEQEIYSDTVFKDYFNRYYQKIHSFDPGSIEKDLIKSGYELNFRFKTAAQKFKMIKDNGRQTVLVNFDKKAEAAIAKLRNPFQKPTRSLFRSLQRYNVDLPLWQFKELLKQHFLEEVREGFFLLPDQLYDRSKGFDPIKMKGGVYDPEDLVC